MIAIHKIWIYKWVIQCQETIFVKIVSGLDNHTNSFWYFATYVWNVFLPGQLIVNGDSEEFSFMDVFDILSINL